MLDGDHAPRGEASTVTRALHFIEDWYLRIAAQQEIAMERMHRPVGVDGPLRCRQSLTDHLAPEDPLQAGARALSPKQVVFQFLEIKYVEKALYGGRHREFLRSGTAQPANLGYTS